jgi:hypothetical protein
MENNTKHCAKCDKTLSYSCFYKNKRRKDGLQTYCKPCMKITNKKNYIDHKNEWDKRSKKYNKTEKNKKYRREWAKKKYHSDLDYRKKCIKRSVEYGRLKLDTDPEYKLKHNLRSRLRKALKGTIKYQSTIELVGCSTEKLRGYLQAKFKDGMTWENYGPVWHVDHIIACANFDLTKKDQQEKCFHYTNLQPLWALENIRKGSKII